MGRKQYASCQNASFIWLMDMQMPVTVGLGATRRIKDRWLEVKVVALTIYPQYWTEAFAAGADTFLLKGD